MIPIRLRHDVAGVARGGCDQHMRFARPDRSQQTPVSAPMRVCRTRGSL